MLGEQKKRTTELFKEIKSLAKNDSADEFNFFMRKNQTEFSYNPKVGEYIRTVLQNRGEKIKIPELAEAVGISKSYLYQIIPAKNIPPKTVKNNPDRKILIALAIALKFSLNETQHLLKYAKLPELYPRKKFDATVIYALERKLSVVETNILLDEMDCELLIFYNN